jgi:hypothetical protein
LLHDIGILVNGVLFPEEFRDVLEEAVSEKVRIPAIERRILGFTHEESGKILAELWRLPIEVSEVVEYHHHRDSQPGKNDLTFLVSVADDVCLKYGLGYGYEIEVDPVLALRELWDSLRARFPKAADYSAEDSQSLIESAVASAISLADHVFSPASTTAGETSQKGKNISPVKFQLVVENVGSHRVRAQHLHIVSTLKRSGILHRAVTHTAAHLLYGTIFMLVQPAFHLRQNVGRVVHAIPQKRGSHKCNLGAGKYAFNHIT